MQRFAEAVVTEGKPIRLDDPFILHLSQRICNVVERIEMICQSNNAFPADLPDRSYRAYLWLRFLSRLQRLCEHLSTLAELIQLFRREKREHKQKQTTLRISIENASYLLRSTLVNQTCQLHISEGFIAADSEINISLIQTLFIKNKDALFKIRQFSHSEAYKHIMQTLWQHTEQSSLSTKGHLYDLKRIFQRVNRQYFQNSMQPPRLIWSSRVALRRLGYYHPDMDTVTISRALDCQSAPPYVLEYVMYHELLHKKLGLKMVNSRRMAHTRQFKRLEKKFTQYQLAEKFIKNMHADRKII
jgi:predicted metal-dependent hydrolase